MSATIAPSDSHSNIISAKNDASYGPDITKNLIITSLKVQGVLDITNGNFIMT